MTNEKKDGSPPDFSSSATGRLIKNRLSMVGLALAVVAFANILFLILINIISKNSNPYLGILAYMVVPAFLILGLLLVVGGILLERRRRVLELSDASRLPRIDLNNPTQRGSVIFALSFIVIFALLSAVGSFKAYEATESVSFCGQNLCHALHPEYTAYLASPHARVACVDCHVGPGARWYVHSKLSGLQELYVTLAQYLSSTDSVSGSRICVRRRTRASSLTGLASLGAQLKTFTQLRF